MWQNFISVATSLTFYKIVTLFTYGRELRLLNLFRFSNPPPCMPCKSSYKAAPVFILKYHLTNLYLHKWLVRGVRQPRVRMCPRPFVRKRTCEYRWMWVNRCDFMCYEVIIPDLPYTVQVTTCSTNANLIGRSPPDNRIDGRLGV